MKWASGTGGRQAGPSDCACGGRNGMGCKQTDAAARAGQWGAKAPSAAELWVTWRAVAPNKFQRAAAGAGAQRGQRYPAKCNEP
jgi:hypothetical protein